MKRYNKKVEAATVYDYPVEDVTYDWSERDLWKLRQEITLNSLYTNDFENSFGVIPRKCQDFFDGWFEDIAYEVEEQYGEDADVFDYLDEFDTAENLYEYWYGVEYPQLNPMDIMIEKYSSEIDILWDDGGYVSLYSNSNVGIYLGERVDDSLKTWEDTIKEIRKDSNIILSGDPEAVLDDDYELNEDYTIEEAKKFGEALKKLADYIEAIIE